MAIPKEQALLAIGVFAALFLLFSFYPATSAHVGVDLAQVGLNEGDLISAISSGDPDIYIVNEHGYKRLFLNPEIFGFYGHLKWENVKEVTSSVRDMFATSGLFRSCEVNDPKVYAVEVTSEDAGIFHWVNVTAEQALAEDHDFFEKTFCINSREFNWYQEGQAYNTLSQVPVYARTNLSTPAINETNMPLTLPDGFRISLFTQESLGPIRFMAFSPDGILFVSMPSTAGLYRGRGGGKVFALPDRNQDGKVDAVQTVLTGLSDLPHGLAFFNGYLYVAEENRVSRYLYQNDGNVGAGEVIVDNLPAGGEDSHVSRTIGFSPAGKMYVSVGSTCNVCEEQDARRAAIVEYNPDGTGERVFASGIRNAVGFVFHPQTGEIWATENGRDWLGDDLPPDEILLVREGRDYGWPYCYGKNIPDPFGADIPASLCIGKEPSLFDIQAHAAPLGLRFIESQQFPQDWQGDLVVASHGSWNRTEPVGYTVLRLDLEGNSIVGIEDFISGWLLSDGSKVGRPVDVIFGPDGALYISDDFAGVIYRVTRI